MNQQKRLTFECKGCEKRVPSLVCSTTTLGCLVLCAVLAQTALASENVPHRPFALWADLPAPGQFVAGIVYEESEAYHIWASGKSYNVTWHSGGEEYGIDVNQGYLALQYGLTPRWALDLNIGATTAAWRFFQTSTNEPQGKIHDTTGLMDWSFGARYQIFKEDSTNSPWLPTLTFRAGAVLPGTYDENFAFAPGTRGAAIEPELLARKHFGWPGLGAYFDGLFRWNRTTANDQYFVVMGLFQQIKGWELDVGYRHLQSITGDDIVFGYDPANPGVIQYPRDLREINDSIEAGFSYTTSKRHIRYGFHSRTVFDGNNSDRKFWVGGSIDIPFGGKHSE